LNKKKEEEGWAWIVRRFMYYTLLWCNVESYCYTIDEIKKSFERLCKLPIDESQKEMENMEGFANSLHFKKIYGYTSKSNIVNNNLFGLLKNAPTNGRKPWIDEIICKKFIVGIQAVLEKKMDQCPSDLCDAFDDYTPLNILSTISPLTNIPEVGKALPLEKNFEIHNLPSPNILPTVSPSYDIPKVNEALPTKLPIKSVNTPRRSSKRIFKEPMSKYGKLIVGARVEVIFYSNDYPKWYAGIVSNIFHDNTFEVKFDDGDTHCVDVVDGQKWRIERE